MWAVEESRALAVALDNLPFDEVQAGLDAILAEGQKPDPSIEALPDNVQAVIPPLTLTASGPSQARAPRGTPIGGEWIETPGGMLDGLHAGGDAGGASAPAGVQDTVKNQGGASIDPLTGLQPTDGYMVAVQGFNEEVPQDEFFGEGGADRLVSWMDKNREALSQPGGHIGLWWDTENGEVVFDVSQRVDTVEEAIKLGGERNQQAIWDVANGEEISTGGTGDRQASAYRMEDYGRDTGPQTARRTPPGLGRVGRGAQARVRAGDDRRAPGAGLSFQSADQVRAPKGTPQGGQWIDTPGGMARQIRGVNIAVDNLGKPVREPQSYDQMDDNYNALVEQVNPGYLENPDDEAYNMNCQRVVNAMEMRARGFDAAANAFDGTRDDTIAIENCWVDPQTGSVRLFTSDVPPNWARKELAKYPPGARFIIGGYDTNSQFGHVWNAEIQPDGSLLEVDGQGGTWQNFGTLMDDFDGIQYLRVDDLTPTEDMLGFVGGNYPMVVPPEDQRKRLAPGLGLTSAAEVFDPVEAGAAAGYEVIEARDLGTAYHLIIANPVRKFSDSLLVMDKASGWVGYVSRFTHPSVQTVPQEDAMASRFAEPPVTAPPVTAAVSRETFSPTQARAPKGTPIGGEWIKTVTGWIQDLTGIGGNGEGSAGPLVESKAPPAPPLKGDFSPVTPETVDKKGKPLGEAADYANRMHEAASEVEPQITRDITDSLAEGGMDPAGLEFRLKEPASLARKIRDDAAEKLGVGNAAAGMWDATRYTGTAPSADLARTAQASIDALRAKGYQTAQIKPWVPGPNNPYRGINIKLLGPGGDQIELQFHTPESLAAKFKMHGLYDQQKLLPKGGPEWTALNEESKAISAALEEPPGWQNVR